MEIYFNYRCINLAELNKLAEEREIKAWLIGEYHFSKSNYSFQKKVIDIVRPEYILSEGGNCSYRLNEKKEIKLSEISGKKTKIVNCRASEKKIKEAQEKAIADRYGTGYHSEIADKFFGIKDLKAARNEFYKYELGKTKPNEIKMPEISVYEKFQNKIWNILDSAKDFALETCIGEKTAKYMILAKRPLIVIAGDDHMNLKKSKIFDYIKNQTILLLNVFESRKIPKKEAKNFFEMITPEVLSYKAAIINL